MTIRLTFLFIFLTAASVAHGQSWWLDFNSLSQDNGPHPTEGYLAYDAGHEVAADFVTQEYDVFGTTVSFTPSWPDSTDNRTQQMIDRGTQSGLDEDGFPIVSSHDANWLFGDDLLLKETGTLDLVTDWIGVDTRTGNGGNGDYDGDVGDPTRILFTLGGIPAGEYAWTSFHHDTENIHTFFQFDYSTDGGETFQPVGDGEFQMSSSAEGGNPANPDLIDGLDDSFEPIPLEDLPSSVQFNFDAVGDDVVLQFTPLSAIAVHQQIFGVNGFQLEQLSTTVVEPTCDPNTQGDLDGNGQVEFADFLILSNGFGQAVADHTEGDIDCNGQVEFADFLVLSSNFGSSVGAEASAVPEPSGLALLSIAGMLLGLVRRRK